LSSGFGNKRKFEADSEQAPAVDSAMLRAIDDDNSIVRNYARMEKILPIIRRSIPAQEHRPPALVS